MDNIIRLIGDKQRDGPGDGRRRGESQNGRCKN